MSKQILILPGDGIGPEIMAEAVKVLTRIDTQHTLGVTLVYDELGGAAYDKYGSPLADETLERARAADAVLLGAVGGPQWDTIDPALRPERGLLKIRSQLGLFANLRPALLYPQLADASTLKPEVVSGLDLLILRELTGGIYFGQPRGTRTLDNGERQAYDTLPYSESEIRRIAKAKKSSVGDVTVCILDRPRHESLVQEVREAGARITFITDGDVAGAIAAAREGTGVDLLLGIGGTPEGIIAACALKCMGGALQGRLWPKDDEERQQALDAGHDLDRVLHIDDLVRGDVFFVATGITDGELLRGVQYRAGGCTTQSLVMRSKSGTIRSIESLHSLEKLRAYSAVPFDRDV